MTTAYGPTGLKQYDKAVQAPRAGHGRAQSRRPTTPSSRSSPPGAKQTRKSDLAEKKAIALAPKDQRKQLKSEIDLQKSQLTATQPGQSSSG